MLEGVLIVLAALFILREAYDAVTQPRAITAPALGMLINSLATILNAVWCWLLIDSGRRLQSPALTADGWHLATDVATSLGVLAGLLLALATGWHILDPIMAVLVAANIIWAGWRLTTNSMSGLMDEAVSPRVLGDIRTTIAVHATGAIQVHDLKTRSAGQATFIEFHLVVPGSMTVAAAHQICDRIEAALGEAVAGAEVLIHVEPEGEAQQKGVLHL